MKTKENYQNWIDSNIKDEEVKKAIAEQLGNNDKGLGFFLHAKTK